ncbi:MAG TPA: sigma-70 family RNA polymerase sigma factor [Actinomycetes bacterium]|nr:sigma-70 family RNA polymerase sigma factor [Actinomycetes bacterium]
MLPPFYELVDAYWRDVARLCRALAGPDDGEDAAQRAWLNALRAYPSLKHGRNLKGWLLTVAARAAMDGHRDRARRPVPMADPPERAGPGVGEPGELPSELPGDGIWTLVAELPERERIAIGLRYVVDQPHAEIAAAIGVSEAMSRRLVSDGLAKLRTAIRETEEKDKDV